MEGEAYVRISVLVGSFVLGSTVDATTHAESSDVFSSAWIRVAVAKRSSISLKSVVLRIPWRIESGVI